MSGRDRIEPFTVMMRQEKMSEREQQAYDTGFAEGVETLRKEIQDKIVDRQILSALDEALSDLVKEGIIDPRDPPAN